MLSLAKILPINVHAAVLDYGDGAALLALPVLLKFDPASALASRVIGGMTLGTSLLTRYPISAAKVLPIQAHAAADYGAAALLLLGAAVSPGKPAARWAHVLIGGMLLAGSLITDYEEAEE